MGAHSALSKRAVLFRFFLFLLLPEKMPHITEEYVDGNRMINRHALSCWIFEKCICIFV